MFNVTSSRGLITRHVCDRYRREALSSIPDVLTVEFSALNFSGCSTIDVVERTQFVSDLE